MDYRRSTQDRLLFAKIPRMTSVLYPFPRIMPGELMLALWMVAAIATVLVGWLALIMRPWRVIVPIMLTGSYCLAVVMNVITFRIQ
jgi:hypothetical protein